MRRKILLLQPTVGEWDEMRTAPALPLALLHAATLVAEEYDVEIFDRRLHRSGWEAALAAHIDDRLMLVGATAFTGPMLSSSLEMCRVIRAHRPDLPIVWGGIHASLLPQETAKSPWADYVVQGEGEVPLRDLARCVDRGESPEGIPGIWYRQGGEVVGTPPGPMVKLEEMPAPPWHLVDVTQYLPKYKGRKGIYFQSSRGCPLPCTYCYNVVFNSRRWRSLSPEKTVEQIRHLVDTYGAEDIYFVDDMFFTNIKRARRIAELLCDVDVTWQVQGVDIMGMKRMTDDDYRLIIKSGCSRLTCGIESGSPRLRRYVKKQGTVEDIEEVTARLAKFPITLYYSFMCGIPTETIEEVKMTVDLIFRLLDSNPNLHVSPLYNFTPYPGTELFQVAQDLGMPMPSRLEDWADFRHEQTNFFPERRDFYESLYFTSLFVDDKTREYDVLATVRLLSSIYRPIARYRTRNFFFKGLLERPAMDVAMKVWRGVGQNILMRKPLYTE
jgi:radical SAM superfamily enzyme YgiQ (UPF0313 family)